MGMRLALNNGWPQMRHGAGKTTEASASKTRRMLTDELFTDEVRL